MMAAVVVSSVEWEVGQLVRVDSRTTPGINREGGVGRITKVHYDKGYIMSVDVKYLLGGSELQLDLAFVHVHAEIERASRSRRGRDFYKAAPAKGRIEGPKKRGVARGNNKEQRDNLAAKTRPATKTTVQQEERTSLGRRPSVVAPLLPQSKIKRKAKKKRLSLEVPELITTEPTQVSPLGFPVLPIQRVEEEARDSDTTHPPTALTYSDSAATVETYPSSTETKDGWSGNGKDNHPKTVLKTPLPKSKTKSSVGNDRYLEHSRKPTGLVNWLGLKERKSNSQPTHRNVQKRSTAKGVPVSRQRPLPTSKLRKDLRTNVARDTHKRMSSAATKDDKRKKPKTVSVQDLSRQVKASSLSREIGGDKENIQYLSEHDAKHSALNSKSRHRAINLNTTKPADSSVVRPKASTLSDR